MVEIAVGCQLKPTKIREIPTKEVDENPVLTNCFIVRYRSFEDWPVMFNFFKELFLFLSIPFLYFVSLFIKAWIECLALPAIICSKLTIETNMIKVNNKRHRHWLCSAVFIVSSEHISHFVLVFLLLTLSR